MDGWTTDNKTEVGQARFGGGLWLEQAKCKGGDRHPQGQIVPRACQGETFEAQVPLGGVMDKEITRTDRFQIGGQCSWRRQSAATFIYHPLYPDSPNDGVQGNPGKSAEAG